MSDYPPLADYGYIADCHTAALISRSGSVDWMCVPRYDHDPCFGRLLDWHRGGYCSVNPTGEFTSSRRYAGNSLILETMFETPHGRVRLTDCFSMRKGGKHDPDRHLYRILDGLDGDVEMEAIVSPRFDYGALEPWIRKEPGDGRLYAALGGDDGLLVWSDFGLSIFRRHSLRATFTVGRGRRKRLYIEYRKPELIDERFYGRPTPDGIDKRVEYTAGWWGRWSSSMRHKGRYADTMLRSAIVLKGLTNAPTGAIAAAPTTSLPESPGGVRNWDYRFSWIRDSAFTVRALADLGFVTEADGFRRFMERTAAGRADQLQIMFGIGGERALQEREIDTLEGYRGAKPVRAGNAAQSQLQLDMYGELVQLAWRWHKRGHSPDDDYWEFITELVDAAARRWSEPDCGIWEIRGEPRHFVHSKAMCWAALNFGIALATDVGRDAPIEAWAEAREQCKAAIERHGFDEDAGTYVQSFGSKVLDSSVLLLPSVGYIPYDDERMISTVDVLRTKLDSGGLLLRYEYGTDGIEGREGAFLPCTFWLAECLARQGRIEESCAVFERALGTGNDLQLFAEEFDMESDQMLGNFPQGLTHLSLITAALALREALEDAGRG